MLRKTQGTYEKSTTAGESVLAFIPNPLPPRPPLQWSPALTGKFEQALVALGRLDSISALLPDTGLFLYMYVRKEAVLSSMIEGTQSSLSDLLLFEMDQEPGVPIDDVQEVSNYVAALNYGLQRIRNGFPLSLRLFKEIHAVLLRQGRGKNKTPGEFRRSQNWIGGTRPGNASFVPPPAHKVMECLGALELFLHNKPEFTPALVKAGLVHVQFETIHPFLDGNGRLGRLLITLLLCEQKILREPILYLSLYFKEHRQQYYDLLNAVRIDGEWENWLLFFTDAVTVTANQAVNTTQKLINVANEDREKIKGLGRSALSTLEIHKALLQQPIATASFLSKKTGITMATVNKCLEHLCSLGISMEITRKKRNRIFSYSTYIDTISRGLDNSI